MKIFLSDSPDILVNFLTYLETIKGKSEKTIDAYHSDLRTFFRFIKVHKGKIPPPENFMCSNKKNASECLKEIPVNDIDAEIIRSIVLDDLYAYLAYVGRVRENQARTRARKVASLKSFFKYLCSRAKLIDDNPARDLETPKIGKTLPRYLELDDSVKLLKTVSESAENKNKARDYLIITLLLNCGLRISELAGINRYHVRENTITVTGKGNAERVIYLNDACREALADYLSVRPKSKDSDEPLLLSKNRMRLGVRSIQNIVKKYMILSDLDYTKYSAHKLRHTAATLMYSHGGVDIRILKEILGHKNISTTEIYTHINQEHLKNAVEKNPLSGIKSSGK